MKLRERLALWHEKAKISAGRFPVAFVNIGLFFVLMLVGIWTNEMNDFMAKLTLVFICSAVFSVVVSLFGETNISNNKKIPYLGITVSSFAEVLLFVLAGLLNEAVFVRVVLGIIFSSIVMSFYFLSRKGKAMSYMARALKNIAFSAFVGLVIFVGGLICIYAFDILIYSNYIITDNVMLSHLIFCCSLFSVLLLTLLPQSNEEEVNPGKGYKAVTVFAGLSIYFLLSAILYLYIIRIIIPAELPSGGVNPFVTMASAAYIFFIFAINGYENESAYARFFSKFGGYLMIPLVIVQCTALGIRIYHYGLTSARLASICFIAVTVIFILGSIFKNRIGFGLPCIVSTVIILVMTITPFNIISIPLWNQEYILESTLEKSGMLQNGAIDMNVKITPKEKATISSAYRYISRHSDDIPEYIKAVETEFAREFVWYYTRESDYEIKWCYYDNGNFASTAFDISKYSEILYVNKYLYDDYDDLFIEYKDTSGEINKYSLEEHARQLYEAEVNGEELQSGIMVYLDDHVDFYYSYMAFSYNTITDEITNLETEGFLLFK